MTVPCPACDWPSSLEARGPAEDPSILLTGTARFGEATLQLVAIRVNPAFRTSPDYKRDVLEDCYQAGGLDVALEEALDELESAADQLSAFLSGGRQDVVTIADQPYRVWLISAPCGSLISCCAPTCRTCQGSKPCLSSLGRERCHPRVAR